MSIIDNTMEGIYDALVGGTWVHYLDVRQAVIDNGGGIKWIPEAAKRLRDMGFPITVDQKAQYTQWCCYPSDAEQQRNHERILRDTYSEFISTHRALAGAQAAAPTLATYRVLPHVESAAISAGRALGKTLAEIAADLAPLPVTINRSYP